MSGESVGDIKVNWGGLGESVASSPNAGGMEEAWSNDGLNSQVCIKACNERALWVCRGHECDHQDRCAC